MALYEQMTFTQEGTSLLSRIYLNGTLEFTKLVLSDKQYNGQGEIQSVKQEFPITSFSYVDSAHLSIRSVGNNEKVEKGYFAKSIGIYAADPLFGEILFCYSNADPADYISAYNKAQGITELEFHISFAIQNADSVVVEVQSQGYAMKTDFDEAMNIRPPRYLTGQVPLLQHDYYIDLICENKEVLLQRIEKLKNGVSSIKLDSSAVCSIEVENGKGDNDYPPTNLIDGNLDTKWQSLYYPFDTIRTPIEFMLTLDGVYRLDKVVVTSFGNMGAPKKYEVFTSEDKEKWTDAYVKKLADEDYAGGGVNAEIALAAKAAQYVKIIIDDTTAIYDNAANTFAQLAEIELYELDSLFKKE